MKTILSLLLSFIVVGASSPGIAADAELARLAAANNNFAFKLLKQLSTEHSHASISFSPYGVATILQIAANGAAGDTRAEMQRVLEINGIPLAKINEASKSAAVLLNSSDTDFILTTANALWYHEGAPTKAGLTDANQRLFSSTVKALDFGNASVAEAAINRWASEQTHGRITDIASGMINPKDTDLVLVNAVYFRSRWLHPFDKSATKERTFHPAAGPVKIHPAMAMYDVFSYRKGSGYQAVRLPYQDSDLAMYVFLPDPGSSPEKLLQIMNGENWRKVTIPGFTEQQGRLVLPKFKLETSLQLNSSLKALGMKQAFDSKKANFSEWFAERECISDIRRKAFVEANEEGTEAAAVTALAESHSGSIELSRKPFDMIVNRPFIFAIVDAHTGMILFMGLVEDV